MEGQPSTPPRDGHYDSRTPRNNTYKTPNKYQLITPITASSKKGRRLPNNNLSILSPEDSPKVKKKNKDFILRDSPIKLFTKKSTVGSGRSAHGHSHGAQPSGSSNLLHKLNSIFDLQEDGLVRKDEINKEEALYKPEPPRTPTTTMYYEDNDKKPLSSDTEDEEEIIVAKSIKNPFVDSSPSSKTTLINPFITSNNVDYSSNLELVNHTTGKKFLKKLSKSQKKIKPKRLDFTEIRNDENMSNTTSNDNNKHDLRNLYKSHKLRSKGSLNFNIFNDEFDDDENK